MEQFEQFAKKHGLEMKLTQIAKRPGDHRFHDNARHWQGSITNGRRVLWLGYYSQGPAIKETPTIGDILWSLQMDTFDCDREFGDWATDYGFEVKDHRKAYAIWEECNNTRRCIAEALPTGAIAEFYELEEE